MWTSRKKELLVVIETKGLDTIVGKQRECIRKTTAWEDLVNVRENKGKKMG